MNDYDKKTIEFLQWCHTPMYRRSGELGFKLRATAQWPDYNEYVVIDDSGNSVLPHGKFLTAAELYEYWLQHK